MIQILYLIIPLLTALCAFVMLKGAISSRGIAIRIVCHIGFFVLAVALMNHWVPGFHNIIVIDAVKFSKDSLPFTMYINFDKSLLGFMILTLYGFGPGPFRIKNIMGLTAIVLVPCAVLLIGLALAVNFVRFDFKIPAETGLWAINNLMLVCMAEEAFFRRYIQGGLRKIMEGKAHGPWVALIVGATFFGMAHWRGGLTYVILSIFAGLFYGYAYQRTQRVEAAMLTNFGLNLIHFLFFSYPALVNA